mmetsp:Transcript_100000/g.173520  ORF Transcript_100000/g.173520 Transcript_100000/m.173520 type:complete len:224 (+) Transcript_100000:109-780(+)
MSAIPKSPALVEALQGNPWQVSMMEAPCYSPSACCCASLNPCCTIYSQRKDILSITNEQYYLFGGACVGCAKCPCGCCSCCGKPVSESMVPCCLGFESCCCAPTAVQINRFMIQTRFGRENTKIDNCLISFANCLQASACICQCVACIASIATDQKCDDLDKCADCMMYLADCVQCAVCCCMTAQQKIEVDYVKENGYTPFAPKIMDLMAPTQKQMITGMHPY